MVATARKILCFGEALWDFPPGGKVPGGAPMNVALRLTQFGHEARLLSRVGNDELGRELLTYLSDRGLNINTIQIDERYPTGCVNVDVSNPREAKYDIVDPSAWDFIEVPGDGRLAEAHIDMLVFGSLALRNQRSRASLFQLLERSTLRVFDVNLRPPYVDRALIERLLHRSHWVKLNDTELIEICYWHGHRLNGDVETSIRDVAERYSLDKVCVTRGHRGAVVLDADGIVEHPGFDVPVVDTVGCGDSFLACWLSQLLSGRDPAAALAAACAMGALVATCQGGNPELYKHTLDTIIAGQVPAQARRS